MPKLSSRLATVVDALPLRPGVRILEVGCATGAAAAEIARRIGTGKVLGIDRSRKAIDQARKTQAGLIEARLLEFVETAVEDFKLRAGEKPYDFAFAIRVGALDGRHAESEAAAKAAIKAALAPGGRLFIDGGSPLKIVPLGS